MTEPQITPPPKLVLQWLNESVDEGDISGTHLANRAAQWGADQELEACCEWVETECPGYGRPYEKLRAARRPKPPSLKEQALKELQMAYDTSDISMVHLDTIRRALEQLDD